MTAPTKRDHIWATALRLARSAELSDWPTARYSLPGVTVEHVVDELEAADVEVGRRTVRDTLDGMTVTGVLTKRGGGGRAYSVFRLPRDHPFRDDPDE